MRSLVVTDLVIPCVLTQLVIDPCSDASLFEDLGAVYWIDPLTTSTVGLAAASTLVDGSMEEAGIGSWGSSDAVLAKIAGSPGGSGSQVLEITSTAATFYATQNCMITGNHYVVDAFAANDGSANVVAYCGAASNPAWIESGTPAWQTYSGENTAVGPIMYIGSASAAGVVRFDDVVVTQRSIASVVPRMGGLNRLADGHGEYTGTAEWVAATATISKQAGARTGGSGSQVLRIEPTSASGYASQDCLVVGHTHRIRGWARGAGSVTKPLVYVLGLGAVWTGTDSTDWQYFDVTFTASNVQLRLYGSGLSTYCEFDDVTLIDLDEPAGKLVQGSATVQPWVDSVTGGIHVDTGDLIPSDLPLCAFDLLHRKEDVAGGYPVFSICGAAKIDDISSTTYHGLLYSGQPGFRLYVTDQGVVVVAVYNATTAVANDSSDAGVIASGRSFTWRVVSDGVNLKVYIDGIEVCTDAYSGAVADDKAQLAMYTGSYSSSNYIGGSVIEYAIFDYALDATQGAQSDAYLSKRHGIPLASDALSDAELLAMDGLAQWVDPVYTPSDIGLCAQPSIPSTTTTVGWSAGNGATLSTVAGGYAGIDCLRITGDGATTYPNAVPSAGAPWIVGNRYDLPVFARGDGSAYPQWYTDPSNRSGTTSTDWQNLSEEFTAGGTTWYLRSPSASAVVDFHIPYTPTNQSIASLAIRGGTITDAYAQGSATLQAWKDRSSGAVRFDGTADYFVSGAAASSYKFLHDGVGGTAFVVATAQEAASTGSLLDTLRLSNTRTGVTLRVDNRAANWDVGLYIGNSSGTAFAFGADSATGIVTEDAPFSICYTIGNGRADAYVNDMSTAVLGGALTSPDTGDPDYSVHLGSQGAGAAYLDGEEREVILFNRVLSLTERKRVNNKLSDRHAPKYAALASAGYGSIPHAPEIALNENEPWTISYWSRLPATTATAFETMFGKMSYTTYETGVSASYFSSGANTWAMIWLANDFWGDYIELTSTASTLDDGAWHHFLWEHDGSGTAAGVTLTLDGVADALSSSGAASVSDCSNTDPLEIGAFTGGSLHRGDMDQFALWQRVLTAGEKAALVAANRFYDVRRIAIPDYYSNFDRSTFPVAADLSGNGNDATFTGGSFEKEW